MIEKTVITSPVAGEVIQRNKEKGEMAITGTINTPGSVIMTIADRSRMFVKALVDETEIVRVALNQPVSVTIDAFPDTVFQGKVVKIGGLPTTSTFGAEEAVNFPIEVEISGVPENLYPGMSASCEITVGVRDSVIVIPYMALGNKKIKGKEQDIVILAEDSRANLIPVKLGLTGEKGLEIKSGISPKDTVLTGPYKVLRELKDGEKVKVKIKSEFERQKPERKIKKTRLKIKM
jgi:HlyD family secretion protein